MPYPLETDTNPLSRGQRQGMVLTCSLFDIYRPILARPCPKGY